MIITTSNYLSNTYSIGSNRVQDKCDSPKFKIESSNIASTDSSVDVWTRLGNKYDIHNATFKELCEISHELYINGKISLLDHGILTMVPNILIKESRKPDKNIFLTPADKMGRRDWIAELQAQANFQFRAGNINGYAKHQQLAKILGQIKS